MKIDVRMVPTWWNRIANCHLRGTMMREFLCTLLFMMALPEGAMAVGSSIESEFPDDADVELSLTLEPDISNDGEITIPGKLIIRNASSQELKIQHPENRQVLTFLVTDEHGNVVSPRGNAKVSPMVRMIALKPEAEYVYKFERLWFLTGTARFGYNLEKNKTYRVIASYRPAGPQGPGFTSVEAKLIIKDM